KGGALGELCVKDLFDPDGKKGINAIIINTGAVWCGMCRAESSNLPTLLAGSAGKAGVNVAVLVYEDGSRQPATTDVALAWKQQWGLTSPLISVLAGPEATFVGTALPSNVLVNPRTLEIVSKHQGGDGSIPMQEAETLAAKLKCR